MATAAQTNPAKDDKKKPPPRPVGEIRRDLEDTRQRLAGNIAQLKAETQPKALGNKAQTKAKSVFVNPDGSVKVERVAAVAGVAIGLILLSKGIKSHKRKKELRALAQVVWVPVPRKAVSPELIAVSRNAKELAPLTEEYVPALVAAQA